MLSANDIGACRHHGLCCRDNVEGIIQCTAQNENSRHSAGRCAMKMLFIVLILCTVFSLNSYAEPNGETKIEPAGQTVLLATVDLHKVRAVIQTHIVDIGKIGDGRPKDVKLNCTYSRYPCRAVDIIAIFVDGNSVFVPAQFSLI